MPRPTGERRDRPTMHDVAEHAGVSLKSVSRVINDESGASPQTRTRVWTAIRELGYQRNDTAHALRRRDGRSACLGVVLDDVGNTFAAAVHSGVVQVANTHRCLVLAASTHGDPDIERQLVYRLLGRRVDGLVIMSARTDHSYLTGELERGVPIVFVDRPARGIRATSVLAANRAATREAVEHLIAHGHRRIAFLSDWPTLYTTAQRHRGYLDAHHAHKLPVQRDLQQSGLVDAASTQHALSTLLTGQDPPTAPGKVDVRPGANDPAADVEPAVEDDHGVRRRVTVRAAPGAGRISDQVVLLTRVGVLEQQADPIGWSYTAAAAS